MRPPRSTLARVVVPVLLGGVYLAQCAWFIQTQSFTYDEPLHITAGLEAWRYGQFERLGDHPPLARLLCALPLVFSEWPTQHFQALMDGNVPPDPRPMAWAWRTRPMNALLGLGLGLLLWSLARRLWSIGAANLVLALFVFSPPMVAHFSVVTTDGVGALATLAAALQLARWYAAPDRRQTIITGIVLGGMLIAKFHTAPLFLVAILMMLLRPAERGATAGQREDAGEGGGAWLAIRRPQAWSWRAAITAAAIAFLVVWATYFFHVARVSVGDGRVTAFFPGYDAPIIKEAPTPVRATFFVPAGEYVSGLLKVALHNRRGHPAFLLGEVSQTGGWPWYFPAAMLLKWPTTVLALVVAGATLLWRRRVTLPAGAGVAMVLPVVFFGFALLSRISIGDRHVLPLYPLALLAGGLVWEHARRRRAWRAIVLAALAVHAADGLRYAPDHLSYFTPFVRPDAAHRLLTDSNLDWGQGLVALRRYQGRHPDEPMALAYFGKLDPRVYGIRYRPLSPRDRVMGTVVVSATHLSGQYLSDPSAYHWLLAHPRATILNHSLHVFTVSSGSW